MFNKWREELSIRCQQHSLSPAAALQLLWGPDTPRTLMFIVFKLRWEVCLLPAGSFCRCRLQVRTMWLEMPRSSVWMTQGAKLVLDQNGGFNILGVIWMSLLAAIVFFRKVESVLVLKLTLKTAFLAQLEWKWLGTFWSGWKTYQWFSNKVPKWVILFCQKINWTLYSTEILTTRSQAIFFLPNYPLLVFAWYAFRRFQCYLLPSYCILLKVSSKYV